MLTLVAGSLLTLVAGSLQAEPHCGTAEIIDADTLWVGWTRYRLDGIDAPERDLRCLDTDGKLYFCGADAAKALTEMIGGRRVCCEDKGPDWRYPSRRIGVCRAGTESEGNELNTWLVLEGWAIDFMPYSCERFKSDEEDARRQRRGMWNGCFASPRSFRYSDVVALLHGINCPTDRQMRLTLFSTMLATATVSSRQGRIAV